MNVHMTGTGRSLEQERLEILLMPCVLSFLPLPGRAVSLHVVLTPGSDPLALPEPLQQLVTEHGLEPVVTQVPAHAPRTKERWQEQQSVWPTSFHPPLPGSGAAAPPATVTPAAAIYIQHCFRVIIEGAVKACEGRAGSEACERVTIGEGKAGGKDLRGEGDGGGERGEKGRREETAERGVREEMQGEAVDMRRQEEGHGRGHQCGSCDRTEPLNVQQEELLRPCCVEGFNIARQKGNDVQALGDPARPAVSPNAPPCSAARPYLCTGFDAFMLHEPCIMCAMALVHQRVRRVFYAIPNLQGGALGSCWKLHGVKSLNHHYEVFRVDLSQLFSQLPTP
ncbi:unnamed protein product [Closterium sp. Yama58-4]|nr:unnamed protein product [Closterium sp. Yama58-4]